VAWGNVGGSELTNSSYDVTSFLESSSVNLLNIPMLNKGTEVGSERDRKQSKKTCVPIGPTKKGLISLAKCPRIECLSSCLARYLSVVLLHPCIGVPADGGRFKEGGGVLMMATRVRWRWLAASFPWLTLIFLS